MTDITAVLKTKRGKNRVVSIIKNCQLKAFETPSPNGNVTIIFPSDKGTDDKLICICTDDTQLHTLYEQLKEVSDKAKKRRITLTSSVSLVGGQ